MTMTDETAAGLYAPDEPDPVPARPTGAATLGRVVAELEQDLQAPESAELPAERERTLRHPNFTKIQMTWSRDNAAVMQSIERVCAVRIKEDFADLFRIKEEIEQAALYAGADRVTGEVGRPDYAGLPESAKQGWVLELSVKMVTWGQRTAVYWAEAMMAKVVRQEVFTQGYLAVSGRSTVEDRTQAGQNAAMADYYFAITCAMLHKHAEQACRDAERLCQRLKDACSVR